MPKRELTIKDFQFYPLDKLKVDCDSQISIIADLCMNRLHIYTCEDRISVSIDSIKPILRPLSDLKKEIEFEGEKIIPIDWFCKNSPVFYTEYKKGTNLMQLYSDIKMGVVRNFIWKILVENLFDVNDLISQGLAVDINTLNENQ